MNAVILDQADVPRFTDQLSRLGYDRGTPVVCDVAVLPSGRVSVVWWHTPPAVHIQRSQGVQFGTGGVQNNTF